MLPVSLPWKSNLEQKRLKQLKSVAMRTLCGKLDLCCSAPGWFDLCLQELLQAPSQLLPKALLTLTGILTWIPLSIATERMLPSTNLCVFLAKRDSRLKAEKALPVSPGAFDTKPSKQTLKR